VIAAVILLVQFVDLSRSLGVRADVVLARARTVLEQVPVRFALLWSGDDPPRVRAGEAPAIFEACVAEGWLRVPASC